MDKKGILISSVVIALAATMLFATIATPGFASKTVQEFEQSASFVIPVGICKEGDMAHLFAITTVEIEENGDIEIEGSVEGPIVDPSTGEEIGEYKSEFKEEIEPEDLSYEFESEVVIKCDGIGKVVDHSQKIEIEVDDDLEVKHHFSDDDDD